MVVGFVCGALVPGHVDRLGLKEHGMGGECRTRRGLGTKRNRRASGLRMTAAVSSEGDDVSKARVVADGKTAEVVGSESMIGADPVLDAKYRKWRIRTFYSIFLGYACFYFTRNSFTYTAPGMRAALGLSLEQLGVITSVFPLAYGFSKLISGVLADRFSTRSFLAIGITLTGIINIVFGLQTSLMVMIPLWALNGVFQGFGAPPCAKLLTTWYGKSERGTWWGFWNTSHNTGGFLIPLLSGYCVRAFGWQYGMIAPGIIAIAMGAFLFNRIRDRPEDVDLPPIDEYRNEIADSSNGNGVAEEKQSAWDTLKTHVLSNPYVWLLAVSYFFVYFVRQGVSSWAHIFLMDYKMVGDAQEAAFRVSGMEIGGLLGSLTSGWASDRMLRGRRIPIIILWMMGVMASLAAFYYVPASLRYLSWLTVFCIGFFIYGPQMLVGLAGAEIVDKKAVSSTIGLLGWIAYLGASIAGFPLTVIVTNYGWGTYILSLMGFSGIAILLLLPMWHLGMAPSKKMPVPEVALAPAAVAATDVPATTTTVLPAKEFIECKSCAATGLIMRLECGPATPNQALSCKYIESQCPFCGGSGYLPKE